ncbi:MAG: hypothetical protein M3542_03260 [Acidobacteriota bacterium]|nr:hypothetical protein [Acidobacteriota bacterium]MDQ5871962.1 hypothetical protein [Acidobacteriota bacterium]
MTSGARWRQSARVAGTPLARVGRGYALYTLLVSAFFLDYPDERAYPLTHLSDWHDAGWRRFA